MRIRKKMDSTALTQESSAQSIKLIDNIFYLPFLRREKTLGKIVSQERKVVPDLQAFNVL